MLKRIYDILFAGIGLLALGPVFALVAAAIKLFDHGPVLFRQTRVGWRGRPFTILKFRTMVPASEQLGSSVTRRGDARVTALGAILRRTKLDELPQLWNVFKGQMSLVGPRPEVPRYVGCYTREQRRVLELKPGITDLATLRYRNEEQLLQHATDVEQVYLSEIMPAKILLNLAYAAQSNLWEDTKVILQTLMPGLPLKIRAEQNRVVCQAIASPGSPGGIEFPHQSGSTYI